MLIIDIILLIILLGFFVWGWQTGLIKAVGGLVGIIVGIILANKYFQVVADWLLPRLDGKENLAKVLGFLVIFVAVNIVILVAIQIVTTVFKLIPFLTTINRLAGAVLALVGGVLAIGFLLSIVQNFPLADYILNYTENSVVVPWLTKAYDFITPIIPGAIDEAKEAIQ